MVRILVADDELPIREWVVFCIRKLPFKCEIVGVAENGREALDLFRQHRPDLVIADIIMPVMDGIEMLREIRSIDITAKVVFLTSHSNFDYARNALTLGAQSYILKTEIEQETLRQLVASAGGKPDGLSAHIRREAFMKALLGGTFRCAEEIGRELSAIGTPMSDSVLLVAAMRLHHNIPPSAEADAKLDAVEQLENIHCFTHDEQTLLVIANLTAMPSAMMQLHVMDTFARTLNECFGCAVSVSPAHLGLEELRLAAEESLRGLDMAFYKNSSELRVLCATLPRDGERRFSELFQTVQHSKAPEQALADLFNHLEGDICLNLALVRSCVGKLASRLLADRISDAIALVEHSRAINDEIYAARTLSELREKVFSQIAATQDGMRRTYSSNIRRSLAYIEQNYASAFTQSDVAEHVGLSSEHLCRIFKQELGISFIAYLNTYRLEQAMKLLRTTGLKVAEVAERTGYTNLSYFSKIFRKQFGMTPFATKNM